MTGERLVSALLARCPRPREGPFTEPTAGAQPWPRECVLMPRSRPWVKRPNRPAIQTARTSKISHRCCLLSPQYPGTGAPWGRLPQTAEVPALLSHPEGDRVPGVSSCCPRSPTTLRSFRLRHGRLPRNQIAPFDPKVEMGPLVPAACPHTWSMQR
jgi:hypothetical protein